jgi:Ca-activated chloride channel family protein
MTATTADANSTAKPAARFNPGNVCMVPPMFLKPSLTDDEVHRARPEGEESGFGALSTARGRLPLAAMDVRARVEGLLASVTVSQEFRNAFAEPLEATYIFPLPDRSAVTAFRLEVAGRAVEGDIQERGAARQTYDRAVATGHRAAISEEERPGVFTVRVGNIMPGERATVRLTLVGPLPFADGEATFRFPLVVAPRYIPGVPLGGEQAGTGTAPDTTAVPDASRITPPVLLPGQPNPVRLSLAVEIDPAGLPLSEVRSSLHAVSETNDFGLRTVRVQPGERLDRDFVLRLRIASDSAVSTSLITHPEADGKAGTFVLTVVPPHAHGTQAVGVKAKPRDVIFILDRSGSMSGWKMVASRRAVARMIDTLGPADAFNVYAFDDSIETPGDFRDADLVGATDRNRFRAVEWLAGVSDRGGTELAQPLGRAVDTLIRRDPARDRVLVLVTDGQVGNEDQILRQLGTRAKQLRVFTLGVDQAVNEAFLKRLAMLGGGSSEVVESEDRLDEVMDKLHRRIAAPVLTGLRFGFSAEGGFAVEPGSLTPARVSDLFAGAPVSIMGRYTAAAAGTVPTAEVSATDAAGRRWAASLRAVSADDPALPAVWARRVIRDLEDRYAIGDGDRSALERRIVDISVRHKVLSRFTAFVAVDRAEVVNPGGVRRELTQPVEMPAGWGQQAETAQPVAAAAARAPVISAADAVMSDSGLFDAEALAGPAASAAPLPPPSPAPAAGMPAPGGPARARMAAPASHKKQLGGAGGLVRKAAKVVAGLLGGMKSEAEKEEAVGGPAPEPVDLSAYRRRAGELLETLKAGLADKPTALGMLSVKLAELVEDITSVGVAGAEVEPLETLLKSLREALAADVPDAARLESLAAEAQAVLAKFAQGAKPAEGGPPAAQPNPADAGCRKFWA